ncbi:hypothetical protein [Allostreptomyces psammosilenae]|uniref:Uncharacterized protein n=1 Tax=Allostreptomyces psammosilenae TaxID=1892865 RepID=A0A852ZTS8_9ACTN|nr:hypothetical protein [Allostreptomyces psammosilenae]NYI05806.1 hypothetical protein [Allostreptomyces psammosilenae]
MSPSSIRSRRRPRVRRAAAATAVVALTVVTGANTSATASSGRPAETARVQGSAEIHYAFAPDDTIHFAVDAVAAPFSRPYPGVPGAEAGLPTDARGTISWSHRVAATGEVLASEAAVDCLVTGGRTATVTAVITEVNAPRLNDTIGQRVGISVQDGGRGARHDRLGFSWGVANLDVDEGGNLTAGRTGTCMAPAPFAPVTDGGFTVHHSDLPTGR